MTKRLEDLLNLPPNREPVIVPTIEDTIPAPEPIKLEQAFEEFDKISAALPNVKGLGEISDTEFDILASKAEQAYDDLMDLGMNVDSRYGARMFEVAATMLNAAISAKNAKIDKKLKMVDLQLKKLAIDNKTKDKSGQNLNDAIVDGQGYIVTDRNSIMAKLKKLNK
jgi:copper chaperone CopZ